MDSDTQDKLREHEGAAIIDTDKAGCTLKLLSGRFHFAAVCSVVCYLWPEREISRMTTHQTIHVWCYKEKM